MLHCRLGGVGKGTSSSSSLLSRLELSDTEVYEPLLRALLGSASHFCEVAILKSRMSVGASVQVRKQLARAAGGGILENATVRGRAWYKRLDAPVLTLDVMGAGVRRWFLGHGRRSRVPRPGREGTLNSQPSIPNPEP